MLQLEIIRESWWNGERHKRGASFLGRLSYPTIVTQKGINFNPGRENQREGAKNNLGEGFQIVS